MPPRQAQATTTIRNKNQAVQAKGFPPGGGPDPLAIAIAEYERRERLRKAQAALAQRLEEQAAERQRAYLEEVQRLQDLARKLQETEDRLAKESSPAQRLEDVADQANLTDQEREDLARAKAHALDGAAKPGHVYKLPGGPVILAEKVAGLTPQRHTKLINQKLLDIVEGRTKRLIVAMPPRHAKSTMVSHYFPAWFLGEFPHLRVILASYEASFAASWGRKARDILEQHGPSLFGVRLSPDSSAAAHWELVDLDGRPLGGGMSTAGVGGPITGKAAHVLIIDDPIKNSQEASSDLIRDRTLDWFQSTAYTRLDADPEGAIIVMMTRWHEDDLSGRLIQAMKDKTGEDWEVLSLPALAVKDPEFPDPLGRKPGEALWPERYPADRLEKIRKTLGSGWFAAMYQQTPQPEDGSIFKSEWLQYMPPPPPGYDISQVYSQIVQIWDTAVKEGQENDFSSCSTFGVLPNMESHLLEVFQDKLEMPALLQAVKSQASKWGPTVIGVEDKSSGSALIQLLKKKTKLPIVAVKSGAVDKTFRARLVTPYLENGQVKICKGPWNETFINQLLKFPNTKHDDMVDSFVYGLIRIYKGSGKKGHSYKSGKKKKLYDVFGNPIDANGFPGGPGGLFAVPDPSQAPYTVPWATREQNQGVNVAQASQAPGGGGPGTGTGPASGPGGPGGQALPGYASQTPEAAHTQAETEASQPQPFPTGSPGTPPDGSRTAQEGPGSPEPPTPFIYPGKRRVMRPGALNIKPQAWLIARAAEEAKRKEELARLQAQRGQTTLDPETGAIKYIPPEPEQGPGGPG